jgi:hypothetical protein
LINILLYFSYKILPIFSFGYFFSYHPFIYSEISVSQKSKCYAFLALFSFESYNIIPQLVVDKIMLYGFTVGSVQNIKLRKTWRQLEMAKEGLVRDQTLWRLQEILKLMKSIDPGWLWLLDTGFLILKIDFFLLTVCNFKQSGQDPEKFWMGL